MAFLRRGNIKVPHKSGALIVLTRFDGSRIPIKLADINCWEEYTINRSLAKCVTVYHFLNCTAVQETFEQIDTAINGKAVANV